MKSKIETVEYAKKISKYFDLKLIGSAKLISYGLDEDLINDVDLLFVTSGKQVLPNTIRQFMKDEGWLETETPIKRVGYKFVDGSKVFEHKDYPIPIHFVVSSIDKDYLRMIIDKYTRSYKSDIIQLKSLIDSMKPKDL